MNFRVIYAVHKSGRLGEIIAPTERFPSIELAKRAPFPDGCAQAMIPVDGGWEVYRSAAFGWELLSDQRISPPSKQH
jgi:hypothetical protein